MAMAMHLLDSPGIRYRLPVSVRGNQDNYQMMERWDGSNLQSTSDGRWDLGSGIWKCGVVCHV